MTLVELVTVIAVIGIMTSVTIISLNQSKTRSALDAEVERLISAIREAQNYALTGENSTNNAVFCANYNTYFSISLDEYVLKNGPLSDNCGFYKKYKLENGVKFSGVANGGYIRFGVPHAILSSSGTGTTGDWKRIGLIKGSITHYICINGVGSVKKSLKATCD